ncbi:hypothetical protein APB45_30205 [Pseudomonas aeruginosa]|nr:hypothetical protein APB45_30205 [Pseudomonas aeruginosa]
MRHLSTANSSACPDQTRPDQTRPDQTRPDQTRPDQTRPASHGEVSSNLKICTLFSDISPNHLGKILNSNKKWKDKLRIVLKNKVYLKKNLWSVKMIQHKALRGTVILTSWIWATYSAAYCDLPSGPPPPPVTLIKNFPATTKLNPAPIGGVMASFTITVAHANTGGWSWCTQSGPNGEWGVGSYRTRYKSEPYR